MPFERHQSYTWKQILAELQADDTKPPFALHKGDKVIGFALNRWQNPAAPDEVIVGYGEERESKAEAFIRQGSVVPVLIRRTKDESQWHFAGNYRLSTWTDETAEKNKRVKPLDIPAIYKILFLEEVPI